MGQDHRIEQSVSKELKAPLLEEKRGESIEVSQEQIKQLLDQINVLLNEYTIMPDSFLMPEDYSSADLEQKTKNKLRTTWFFKAFARLESSQDILGADPSVLANLKSDFQKLLEEEAQQTKLILAKEKIDFSDSVALIQRFKEIKRDLAPQFVEAKTQLINAIEFVLKRSLRDLQKKYA